MPFWTTRRALLGAIGAGVGAAWLGRKVTLLSADPLGAKDCGPAFEPGAKLQPIEADVNLPWSSRGGSVNDVSCLSRTKVAGVIKVRNEKDIAASLEFARKNRLKVSMAGARHSMGGHAFAPRGIVLDMTAFNDIKLDADARTIAVQSGVTWHDIQNAIHPRFAVKAMQSSDVFTVGGSISVNAHGMDHNVGAIERTIRKMRVMLADGSIQTISRAQNAELYRHVVGGYGLFAVILDVELDITDNVILSSRRTMIDYADFAKTFLTKIKTGSDIELFYGHLSTAPGSFLKECILYSYHRVEGKVGELPPLAEVGSIKMRRLIFNLGKQGALFQRLKWFAEKKLEPLVETCTISRSEALSDEQKCLVSRNEPMHDSVPYLFNRLNDETDILHEYYIPRGRLVPYLDGARALMERHDTNLLNASLRVVHKENIALNYAPDEAFSLVLYINQKTDADGIEKMRRLTSALIDLTQEHGGRFFLPYQSHYSAAQLKKAYPEIDAFFAKKKAIDPAGLFSNSWYEKYATQI